MKRIAALALAASVAAWPAAAHADAPGPTDFTTRVVAIAPATDAIRVTIEGGDSFVRVVVEPGHELLVLGYHDEPYVRIDADGAVFENRRSFATYYNQDRYGRTDSPAIVDNDAEPDWQWVGDGGAWAWHDHRAHWMEPSPPIGMQAGDSLPTETIPVLVDGTPTTIAVETTLQAEPALWPVVVGLIVGTAIGALSVIGAGAIATGLLAAAALLVGLAQYRSLPAETGPLVTWWLLPALALACAGAALTARGHRLARAGLTALGATFLLVWSLPRRAGWTAAVLPTDVSFWVDRLVSAAAVTGSTVILVAAVVEMFRQPRAIAASSAA